MPHVLDRDDLELDSVCSECWGDPVYEKNKLVVCSKCKGVGRIPTTFGKEVLAFVKHHLKLGE